MILGRAGAGAILAVASLAVLPSLLLSLGMVFLFDAPGAGGWPVILLAAGMVAAPAGAVTSIVAASSCIRRPARDNSLAAVLGLALPAVLLAGGYLTVTTVCHGTFVCSGNNR